VSSKIDIIYAQKRASQDDNVLKSARLSMDTIKIDTISKKAKQPGAFTSKVTYSAEDSIKADIKNNIVFLYGKAKVKYEDFELEADFIRLDQKNNSLFAKGLINPNTKVYAGRPLIIQGAEPPLTTDSLFFNYKTKKHD
jgi:lipopolysaccharide assembly outer membrane protein LptD (OstA)